MTSALMAWLRSPMKMACLSTSTTTVAVLISAGLISLFAGLSAPTAATKVPGRVRRRGSGMCSRTGHDGIARVSPFLKTTDRFHLDAGFCGRPGRERTRDVHAQIPGEDAAKAQHVS